MSPDGTPARPRLITDRIDHFAATTPDETAVRFGGHSWTFRQWQQEIRSVAAALVAAGVEPGQHIAVLDRNHPHCLQLTFAAGLIGAANVVLNFRLAPEELVYVLNDSQARILFVGDEFAAVIDSVRDRLPHLQRVVAVTDPSGHFPTEFLGPRAAPATLPALAVDEDRCCLMLYTSGTTGFPKGAQLTHRSIVSHTVAVSTVFLFGAGDINLVAMPLFHVGGSCYAMFGFHAGVPTIMTRDPDGPSLLGAIAAGASHAFLVPAVIAAIVQAGPAAVTAMGRLRFLGYGASPMPLPLLRTALAAWPDTRFIQVYGMTELSGVVTTLNPDAHRDPAHPERLASAGTVIPGVEIRVVDPLTATDVAPGARGELWFRTDQRMAGYWNNPEATAATITADGWLRSGDVGEQDADGFVYIVDRVKDMIISGGENIYSAEVEQVIGEHPDVAEVAVIGVPDDAWGEAVRAVVAPRPGHTVDPARLIDFCRQRLAHYKCPTAIDVLDALPRNATGKILKRSLRSPYWEGRDRSV